MNCLNVGYDIFAISAELARELLVVGHVSAERLPAAMGPVGLTSDRDIWKYYPVGRIAAGKSGGLKSM